MLFFVQHGYRVIGIDRHIAEETHSPVGGRTQSAFLHVTNRSMTKPTAVE